MPEFNYYQDGLEFSVTRDDELYCTGKLNFSLSTYSFGFSDLSGSKYEMMSSGLFLWRKISLYKNDILIEHYSPEKAKLSKIHFDRRFFIRKNGEYLHHIDPKNEKGRHGRCRFAWSGTPAEIETQVICLVVLRYIRGLQTLPGMLVGTTVFSA